jgi:hypothetical protein
MVTEAEIDIFSITPPKWLDVSVEILNSQQPEKFKNLEGNNQDISFICNSFRCLDLIGNLSVQQIMWVTANCCGESGWGKFWNGFNFGGWKINSEFVKAYKKKHGVCPPWFRAKGHQKGGDDPVVYYRGFRNMEDFYRAWILKFVPKDPSSGERYEQTSKRFWNNDEAWFRELCVSGYKGEDTKAHPDGSVETYKEVCQRVMILFVQYVLGLKYDGSWGPKTTKAASDFQIRVGSADHSGQFSFELFLLVYNKWKTEDNKKLPFSISL